MANEILVKRLPWVYSIFTGYLIVVSLFGIAGVVYLPLRMDMPLLAAWLALYWAAIASRVIKRRQKQTGQSYEIDLNDMHEPDRVGILVLAFAVIALYIGVASLLK